MDEGDERREGRKECIRLDEGKRGSKEIRRREKRKEKGDFREEVRVKGRNKERKEERDWVTKERKQYFMRKGQGAWARRVEVG